MAYRRPPGFFGQREEGTHTNWNVAVYFQPSTAKKLIVSKKKYLGLYKKHTKKKLTPALRRSFLTDSNPERVNPFPLPDQRQVGSRPKSVARLAGAPLPPVKSQQTVKSMEGAKAPGRPATRQRAAGARPFNQTCGIRARNENTFPDSLFSNER